MQAYHASLRAFRRASPLWLFFAAAAFGVVPKDPVPPPAAPTRIIVKFRPEFSQQVETTLNPHSLHVSSAAQSGKVGSFMGQYQVSDMVPLHRDHVLQRMASHLSEADFVATIRSRFAKRAGRHSGTFAPPDISTTYVLTLGNSDPSQFDAVLAQLKNDPNVVFAEPDHIARAALVPTDPYYSSSGNVTYGINDLYGLGAIRTGSCLDS